MDDIKINKRGLIAAAAIALIIIGGIWWAISDRDNQIQKLEKEKGDLSFQRDTANNERDTKTQELNAALAREQKEKSRENWSRDESGNTRVSVDLDAHITGQNPGDDAIIGTENVSAKGGNISVTAEKLRMNDSNSSHVFKSGQLSLTATGGNASIRQASDTRIDCRGKDCKFEGEQVVIKDGNGETHANITVFSNSENGRVWVNSTEAGCRVVKKGDHCGVSFGGNK